MLVLHSVIHWFQDRFLTWIHSLVYSFYSVCTPDWPTMYFFCSFSLVLYLMPMLFFQYGVVDASPDDMGRYNCAASCIDCVILA